MRKNILLFAAAAATLLLAASCNKDTTRPVSAQDDAFRQEIGIRTSAAVRSAIDATAFPEGYDMMVSAYRNIGDLAGEDTSQDYFQGIRFTKTGTSWKSAKGPKFYPLDGNLDFLAIASAGYKTAANGVLTEAAPGLAWGENSNVAKKVVVTVPDNSVKFDDIMYASANAQGLSASGTDMVFHHAMSSVVFVAKCDHAYDAVNNVGITIDKITVDGAKYSGTLTVSNPAAGGSTGSLSAAWSSLGSAKTHIDARVWAAANTGTSTSEPSLSALNLTAASASLASKPFGEGYVILPPQDAVPFTVTYTIHNGMASDGTTPLNKQVQYQYTPTGTWDMNKKNVYEIFFKLTEIIINPSIVDWDDVDKGTVEIPTPPSQP